MHLTRFFAEIWDFNTFVFSALQIRLQNLILHKILIYFKKKIHQKRIIFRDFAALFPSGGVHVKSNVWFKLGVVHTPLAIFSLFSIFLVKSRLRGFSHPYGISLLIWYHPYGISLLSIGGGEIPRISKEGSEIPRAPEGGMYDAKFEPHITHFTFQKIWS